MQQQHARTRERAREWIERYELRDRGQLRHSFEFVQTTFDALCQRDTRCCVTALAEAGRLRLHNRAASLTECFASVQPSRSEASRAAKTTNARPKRDEERVERLRLDQRRDE